MQSRRLTFGLAVTVGLVALVASPAQAATPTPWNEVEPPSLTCTAAELHALGLRLPRVQSLDGWYAADHLQRALQIACPKVPARWLWINRSFNRATQLVDRLYPGSWHGAWARHCASSEGGHGHWVPNRGGSGAGGWLQFMSGTFWSVIDSAIRRARAHGVRVPAFARSWYSPLGQALAGSEMLYHGRRGEWSGRTC